MSKKLSSLFHALMSRQKRSCKDPALTTAANLRRIMILGDSNAFRPGNGKNCWPALLQTMGCSHIRVVNESCDGRTTAYDTGMCNGLGIIDEKISTHMPLDHVIVALGTNDLKEKYGPPRAEEIALNIERIIARIRKHSIGIEPVVLTPPPLGAVEAGDLAGARHSMPGVSLAYRRVALRQKVPIIDIFARIDAKADLDVDSVHLNEKGRRKIAKAVWTHLRS